MRKPPERATKCAAPNCNVQTYFRYCAWHDSEYEEQKQEKRQRWRDRMQQFVSMNDAKAEEKQ